MNNRLNKLNTAELSKHYIELLKQADLTTSRRDAVHLIREADKVRQRLCQQTEHPVCHG